MVLLAIESGMDEATLEVRESNEAARALYRRHGFHEVGRRKRYYPDNGEDAVIMTTPSLSSANYQELLERLGLELTSSFGAPTRAFMDLETGLTGGQAGEPANETGPERVARASAYTRRLMCRTV